MIISKKLVTSFKEVVKYSTVGLKGDEKSAKKTKKENELIEILGLKNKSNIAQFYRNITGRFVDKETTKKLVKWCGSHIYEFKCDNPYTIVSGDIGGVRFASIVKYRIVDVFITNTLEALEFDNRSKVSFQTIELDEVQNAKAN